MNLYKKFREMGYKPSDAYHSATVLDHWNKLTVDLKIDLEPEDESYFDVYGEPEGYTNHYGRYISPEAEKQEIIGMIETNGCWRVFSTYNQKEIGQVGMCIGYDDPTCPFQNSYVIDLMESAINVYEEHAIWSKMEIGK